MLAMGTARSLIIQYCNYVLTVDGIMGPKNICTAEAGCTQCCTLVHVLTVLTFNLLLFCTSFCGGRIALGMPLLACCLIVFTWQ